MRTLHRQFPLLGVLAVLPSKAFTRLASVVGRITAPKDVFVLILDMVIYMIEVITLWLLR